MSPALAGGFLTTEPPGKPLRDCLSCWHEQKTGTYVAQRSTPGNRRQTFCIISKKRKKSMIYRKKMKDEMLSKMRDSDQKKAGRAKPVS